MKKFLQILGISVLFVIFAFTSCGCDSDQDVPGVNNPPDVVGASDSGDEPDTTDPPDELSDDDVFKDDADAELDLFEICGGYIGLWDCTCTEGICVGQTTIYKISPFDLLEHQHTFWLQQVDSSSGVQLSFVCNKDSPPASDGQGTELTAEDGLLHIYAKSQYTDDWFIEECTPHPTS